MQRFGKLDVGQIIAVLEYEVGDSSYPFRNEDRRYAAVPERLLSNIGDCSGNADESQRLTIHERLFSDTGHSVGSAVVSHGLGDSDVAAIRIVLGIAVGHFDGIAASDVVVDAILFKIIGGILLEFSPYMRSRLVT